MIAHLLYDAQIASSWVEQLFPAHDDFNRIGDTILLRAEYSVLERLVNISEQPEANA